MRRATCGNGRRFVNWRREGSSSATWDRTPLATRRLRQARCVDALLQGIPAHFHIPLRLVVATVLTLDGPTLTPETESRRRAAAEADVRVANMGRFQAELWSKGRPVPHLEKKGKRIVVAVAEATIRVL